MSWRLCFSHLIRILSKAGVKVGPGEVLGVAAVEASVKAGQAAVLGVAALAAAVEAGVKAGPAALEVAARAAAAAARLDMGLARTSPKIL